MCGPRVSVRPTNQFIPTDSLHLDEELELEEIEEQQRKIPRESWGLRELKRALQDVSDEEWFQMRDGLISRRLFGPRRASTFKRVFSNVPGAIYGCLKVRGHVWFDHRQTQSRVFDFGIILPSCGHYGARGFLECLTLIKVMP